MRVSGCNGHYEFVLGAGTKAKSVTNNLPILSVLADRVLNLNIKNCLFHLFFLDTHEGLLPKSHHKEINS